MCSGSLLLSCTNYSKYPDQVNYYGKELMQSTYNLARMNMFLHAVASEYQHINCADTLDADWPIDEITQCEHIDHVLKLYTDRQTVEKEAYLASFEDIKKNDFNLNIPRYVDSSEARKSACKY